MSAERFRPTTVEVNLDAIRHNVTSLKPTGAELMAIVKANAYGHGAVPVAFAALESGARWLGVALVEEGLALREAGVSAPILILSECPPGAEETAIEAGLTPTLYSDAARARLAAAAAHLDRDPGSIAVHIKVDTGMHRVGVYPPEEAIAFVGRARDDGFEVQGLYTHFARAEDDPGTTASQLDTFARVTDALRDSGITPSLTHAANSGATVRHPEAHFSLVRPGLAIYGLAPTPELAEQMDLRPALSWRSTVSLAKRLPAGEAVSYGHTYRLERDAWLATVPVGYADGYTRRLSGRAEVLIGGKRRLVAGTVTMDQLLVDCGDDEPAPGEEAVLIGTQGDEVIAVEELAERSGTINYEIVCAIGERVPREYTGGS